MPDLFGGNSSAQDFFSSLGNSSKPQETPSKVVQNKPENLWNKSQNVDFSQMIGLNNSQNKPTPNNNTQVKTNSVVPQFFQPSKPNFFEPKKETPKFFEPNNKPQQSTTNPNNNPNSTQSNNQQKQVPSFFQPNQPKFSNPPQNFEPQKRESKEAPKENKQMQFFIPNLNENKGPPSSNNTNKVQNAPSIDDFQDVPFDQDEDLQRITSKPLETTQQAPKKEIKFFDPTPVFKEEPKKPETIKPSKKEYKFESKPNLSQKSSQEVLEEDGFVDVNINSSGSLDAPPQGDPIAFTPQKNNEARKTSQSFSFFDPTPKKSEINNEKRTLIKSNEALSVKQQLNEPLHFSTDSFFTGNSFSDNFEQNNPNSIENMRIPTKPVRNEKITRDYEYKGAHPLICFGLNGTVVTVFPSKESYTSTHMANITSTKEIFQKTKYYQQLAEFNGPLNKTAKSKLLDLLKKKIENVEDCQNLEKEESQLILWELLRIMTKYDGSISQIVTQKEIQVEKNESLSQVLQLLKANLKGYSKLVGEKPKKLLIKPRDPSEEEQFLQNLQNLLSQGKNKEAVDLAIESRMWEHAFYIARQIDIGTLNNVMAKFSMEGASSEGTPLKTFYLLTSGQIQNIFNENESKNLVSNWKDHLSMIIANKSSNKAAIVGKIGDTLWTKMRIPEAAHFCYILAGKNSTLK